MNSVSSLVVLLVIICNTQGKDGWIPPYINPCHVDDPKIETCIKKQIETSLPHFTKGIPELNVPSLDPVELDDIKIDGNGLMLTFTNAKMHGLSKSQLSSLKVSIGKEDESFALAFKGNMSLTAKYEVDGRILILPIVGKGDALVDCQNIEVTIESKLAHVKDGNGEHFKLVSPVYKYDIEKTTFHLDNLFNGNKQLAETTHQFANDNWRQLMDDLAPPAVKQIVKTGVKSINKFFSKVTISQIVLGYKERL